MRVKRVFTSVLVSVYLAAAFVVPSAFAQEPPAVAKVSDISAKEAYNIGFVIKALENPFWITLDEFGKATGEMLGVNLAAYSAGGESAIENEVRIMEDLISQQVDAIVVAPVDSQGIIPAIEDANAAGIPVITVDTASDGGEIACHVATDNILGGELAGRFTASILNGQGKVAILEGVTGQQVARDRKTGFHNIVDQYPDIEVVASQPANWDKALGLTTAENILTANPDLDLIYACNDQMALGAVEAVEAAGADVLVVGYDGVQEALEAVKAGRMAATIRQNPETMGVLGIAEAVLLLNGYELPAWIDTGTDTITTENVDFYLSQKPTVEGLLKNITVK